MINLAEILTLLIGCLLALVFIDGIRRAIRIRRSKLKVDLISSIEEGKTDFEEEWQGFNESAGCSWSRKLYKVRSFMAKFSFSHEACFRFIR